MKIKKLINKSYYGTQGYISSIKDLDNLERYIELNLDILKEYVNIIVATNFSNLDKGLQELNKKLWCKYFPNVIILDSHTNRGHNHGYCDLENILIEYCVDNNIEWLCKSAHDTILTKDIFNIPLPEEEVDCYYQLHFNKETTETFELNQNKLEENWFSIQGAFYFINTSKITKGWHDKKYLDKTYNHIQKLENYNGKIWEYIPEFECELMIANNVKRNNLTKHYIFSGKLYQTLWTLIRTHSIYDPSHKNILIQGISHLHFPLQNVAVINLKEELKPNPEMNKPTIHSAF